MFLPTENPGVLVGWQSAIGMASTYEKATYLEKGSSWGYIAIIPIEVRLKEVRLIHDLYSGKFMLHSKTLRR